MTERSLLPARASTKFLRAFEQAIAYEPRLDSSIDLIRDVKGRKLPSWLQFLLYEYGLIELTPYVPNAYTLLQDGRLWQIERDTWAAIARGLGWVSSPGQIVEAPARRAWWNSFQLYLDALPPADVPNLDRIEKIVGLSKPLRSDFRRGVNGYDAPALEGDATRLDASLLDVESGVRIAQGGALWSFGRSFEITHTLTEAEGTALGNWIPNVAEAAYMLDLIAPISAVIDELPVDPEDAFSFSRSSPKWAKASSGIWQRFEIDEIASTDLGTLIEGPSERLSMFSPQFNAFTDDPAAAVVDLIGQPDPFGGDDAIRVTFDGDAGYVFLVPAEGLAAATEYSVSFFAKLISSSGVVASAGGPGFQGIFSQLVAGQWVRVEGLPLTTGEIVGQWLDLTLPIPGATLTVELFGFQIEPGAKVTSPIGGTEITGSRAADELTLLLPTGLNNLVVKYDNGTSRSFLSIIGPYDLDPADLDRPLITEIANIMASTWQSMSFPWTEATFPWASDAISQREIQLGSWFEGQEVYLRVKNQAGQIIGYRRCRCSRQVLANVSGGFMHGGTRYRASQGGRQVYIDAMTDAGNGAGSTAKTVEFVFGATRAPGIKPGALWLPPDGLIGGTAIAISPVDIPLRATVRERLKLLLRF